MVIDTFYRALQVLLNKNQMGKISPSEFNSMIFEAQKGLAVEVFSEFRKLHLKTIRLGATPNYGNEAFNNKQVIEYFITAKDLTLDKGKTSLPDDCLFVNSVTDEDTVYFKQDIAQFLRLTRTKKMSPSKCNAIYALMNSMIKVAPQTDNVEMVYYRTAKQPRWTFVMVNDEPMFNPSAPDFQDIDLHESLHPKLFIDVLAMAGLNLRENEVLQYIGMKKQEEQINAQ